MEITVLLLMAIFVINMFLGKPVLDSFMFSLALAVGMTPQLLPAIISVNLSRGAKEMARQKVIVKKLSAIEDFGTMQVLCSDKTGTITQGKVTLDMAADIHGQPSDLVALCAFLNARFQSSYQNQIDQAILQALPHEAADYAKIGEIPYDFLTRRMGVMLGTPANSPFGEGRVLIVKGAVKNLLEACDKALDENRQAQPIALLKPAILEQFEAFSQAGSRALGVAWKALGDDYAGERGEQGLTFAGFLSLSDPLKPGIADTIAQLRGLGVALKIITGDNRLIAAHIAQQLGLSPDRVINGEEIDQMSDSALVKNAADAMIFAEIAPNQKERIILALKKGGQVVGYMGDGINDASALHAADVGISVDTAADVAKDAATIVLMAQDLKVLIAGVREGRKTFANTMKYVFMATSANFGNMFSMAGASLFLPFLPLRSTQVLLTNLLTDFPEMQIAADRVDEEMLTRAQRWNLGFIKRFMLMFGSLSSVFDYLTFAVLLLIFRADETMFQTGWFTESVISAATIVFVVRSRKPLGQSRPGRGLSVATMLVVLATLALPYTPLAPILGFAPLPWQVLLAIFAVVALYVLSGEALKRAFYRKIG
jgi:Mg2+-importing ATPase